MGFIDNGDGTVTDSETGLVWSKDAAAMGRMDWYNTTVAVAALADGQCGLTDGSAPGDWRLPSINEFTSLLSHTYTYPALPKDNLFLGVQDYIYENNYWSGSTNATSPTHAWYVNIGTGRIYLGSKPHFNRVWPVRESRTCAT